MGDTNKLNPAELSSFFSDIKQPQAPGAKVQGLSQEDIQDMFMDTEELKTKAANMASSREDVFTKMDIMAKNISKDLEGIPYASNAYKNQIAMIPFLDPQTKEALAGGDTTRLKEQYGIPILHYLNQRLYNYPRAAAHAVGLDYPEAETTPGKILSQGAGVAGALQGFKGVQNLTSGIGKTVARGLPKYLQKAGRAGIAGALQGYSYSPTENTFDLKQRGMQAVVGGVASMALAPMVDRIGIWAGRATKAWKRSKTGELAHIGDRIKSKRIKKDYKFFEQEAARAKVLTEAGDLLDDASREFTDDISREITRGKVSGTKNAALKNGRQTSKIYEKLMNNISKEIGEINTADYADDIASLKADIINRPEVANSMKGKEVLAMLDGLSKQKTISFKKLNGMRKSVGGKKVFKGDVDDVGLGMMDEWFSNVAAKADPSGKYAALNAKMAPRLSFKHKFASKAKIYDAYESGGLEKMIRDYTAYKSGNLKIGKGITQGTIDLMDDATKYLSKYGMNLKDLNTAMEGGKIIGGTKRGVTKLTAADKIAKTGAEKLRKTIRKQQDIKLDAMGLTMAKNEAKHLADMLIRIMIARGLFNIAGSVRDGIGGSDTTTAPEVK